MEYYIRKNQDRLICSGYGVIVFGAWGIIKLVLAIMLQPPEALKELLDAFTDQEVMAFIIIIVAVAVIGAIDIAIRMFIGLSAIKEGKGEKKGNAYLVVTAMHILFSVYQIASLSFAEDTGYFEEAITILIEITALIALIEIIVSAYRIRKAESSKMESI